MEKKLFKTEMTMEQILDKERKLVKLLNTNKKGAFYYIRANATKNGHLTHLRFLQDELKREMMNAAKKQEVI